MLIHVLNLDRTPDRLQEFLAVNDHLGELARSSAIDGQALDVPALVESGVIEEGVLRTYTRGAIGAALSHVALWTRAIEAQQIMTICEDDAIFNRHFVDAAQSVMARLPADWDLIAWGWNFDAQIAMDFLPGVSICVVGCDQDQMRTGVATFRQQVFSPQPIRLLRSFGAVCYSVSPKGAQALKSLCFPIREMHVVFPGPSGLRELPNLGVDVMMANAYSQTQSFVAFPPLVITKNERAKSTIQPADAGA
ncbi:MAG TPA: glycosyltransferase family 25 protein [Stellaceae bacterium]|nr:glycosyltransferase family 25 protein [Stellaceae bacterium]